MLFEILGILVAFIALILLLSLVVTALVQVTQAVFQMRGRNLRSSIHLLLETALLEVQAKSEPVEEEPEPEQLLPVPSLTPEEHAERLADRITRTEDLNPLLTGGGSESRRL